MKLSVESIEGLLKSFNNIPNHVIEGSLIQYIIEAGNYKIEKIKNPEIISFLQSAQQDVVQKFHDANFPIDIEEIIDFFEALLTKDNVTENGIVFTPTYISDYIVSDSLKYIGGYRNNIKIIDPSCGCGIFLISSIKYIHENYGIPIDAVVKSNIFGIDLDGDNIRRCKIAICLYQLISDGEITDLDLSLLAHGDSLKLNWNDRFGVNGFDVIIGNPPYVNTHDMKKSTAEFLKNTFKTTRSGVYNIFYAFIEHGIQYLTDSGVLSFIVPNNFLTIKSALDLRRMLQRNNYIKSILDFGDNMLFKPVRTYNCIIKVSKKKDNGDLYYYVMPPTENVIDEMKSLQFNTIPVSSLDENGWHLVDGKTRANLRKIESQFYSIKPYIRTGIATLRDNVYIVDCDDNGYYKVINNVRYDIESEVVKKLYKIPELKNGSEGKSIKYIIFPYKKGDKGFEIIWEDELSQSYPNTYRYLLTQKDELLSRDKGNCRVPVWYAYGRTQGLNNYGRKLLFPTFSNTPRFVLIDDEDALFCNGYAIFENEYIELEVLSKILNSRIMEYYISHTSYAIEGGYYCYQKKYIEKFTVPFLSEKEMQDIKNMTEAEIDNFLVEKYDLAL